MADNGNRGPNDSFRRSGKRRREPPIIDAAATEVPLDQAVPDDVPGPLEPEAAVGSPANAGDEAMPPGSEPTVSTEAPVAVVPSMSAEERDAVASHAPDEPVLFGSALRDPERRAESQDDGPAPDGGEPVASEPVAAPGIARDAEPLDPAPMTASDDRVPPSAHPTPATPSPASNGLARILGIATVLLLGVIGWLLYSGGQRGGDVAASVADLKTRVATLEALPDPAALQSQIAALDKRVAATEAERAALGKQLTALAARIDGAGQTAQASPSGAPSATTPGAAAPGSKPADAVANPPSAAPALATMAAVTALAAKVEAIDGRVSAVAADETGTAKALAALPKPVPPDFGPVNAKVAALETEVNAADAKMNGSDARLNGFDARINGIGATVNGFGATMIAMAARMNGLEAKVDNGAARIARVSSDLLALPKVDLRPLQASDAALDARIVKVEAQLAAPKDGARITEARAVGNADEAKATPIAVVGQAIQRAIAAGRPYGPEIDALKALGADPALVARLGPASAGGAPSVDALTSQWAATRGAVLSAAAPIVPAAGGAINRFLASATSIVQVKRVGAVAGEDLSAIVSRIDAAMADGDVPAALAAWDKLSSAGKAASQAWADAARSRVDATGAAGDLVGSAIATLGKSPS